LQQIYDEMQKLMEQMDEIDKEQIEEQLSEMDLDQENLENELDRAIEQFKQLQWEQKMEETIDALEELAEKQEELSENEPDKAAQDSLNDLFDKLREDVDALEKLNKELETPNETPETESQEDAIEEEMKESSEEIEQGKEKKAAESQKSAAEKMKDMAKSMSDSMESEAEEKAEEDMDALRALLENIVQLSFDQEGLMRALAVTSKDDPRYVEHGQGQRKLKDDAEMVKDSLFALSMRVTQLQAIVNSEINLVNHHMGVALDGFTDRETAVITSNQQYVMTSFNNLALLLDEVLKQMQNKSSCDKPGTGNCEKPGGSGSKPSPSPGDLKKMQEALSKQLEKMKEQMGGSNDGNSPEGKRKLSKELAQMAAHQSAIRKMTEQLGKEMNEDGSGDGNGLGELAKEMEQLEKDIVNGQLSDLSLMRQQEILTRLLEAENADRVRGEKEERKSKTGAQGSVSSPPGWDAYQRQKDLEIELLRTVPASLTPYYKQQVNEYFNTLERAKDDPQ
jgi:DNA repair exonuclease SbcCD ATPase subunit